MSVTEEEAKGRWCPFARVLRSSPTGLAGVNRDGDRIDPRTICFGSACMAWRKDHDSNYDGKGNLRGYCGLAGKP